MWPFKQKKKLNIPVLVFKSGQDFFEYHCKFMDTKIQREKPLVAIVLDAKLDFNAQIAVKTDERGIQIAALRVASDDGGFITFSETLSAGGERLSPGDVVAWLPCKYSPESAKSFGSHESGWIGLIFAKIAPEIDTAGGQMKLICHY